MQMIEQRKPMKQCELCKKAINGGNEMEFDSKIICEDCYIDAHMPKMPKSHYNNDAEFMQRLKDSNPARNQQFH